MERKIKELEQDLKRNYDIVQKIGKSVSELLKDSAISNTKLQETVKSWEKLDGKAELDDCLFSQKMHRKADIEMLDVYKKLDFDNPDGGVWKQGWDVQYNPSDFSEGNKLKVFVVPHSHNDPGWIKTFEKYYEDQTRYVCKAALECLTKKLCWANFTITIPRHIFNNMVRKLSEDSSRKFIWAEISYLDLWWKESEPEEREKFKQLVKTGQIEIVTGGWVMNDEANTHYYAMIEQLTSGNFIFAIASLPKKTRVESQFLTRSRVGEAETWHSASQRLGHWSFRFVERYGLPPQAKRIGKYGDPKSSLFREEGDGGWENVRIPVAAKLG